MKNKIIFTTAISAVLMGCGSGGSDTQEPPVLPIEQTDTSPADITVANIYNAVLDEMIDTPIFTVSDIDAPVDISIEGGEYKVNDEEWTSEPGTVENGDKLTFRGMSPDIYVDIVNGQAVNPSRDVTFTIGDMVRTFTIYVAQQNDGADILPDSITIEDKNKHTLGEVVILGPFTVSGIETEILSDVTNADLQINDGEWTSDPVYIENGDTFMVRYSAPDNYAESAVLAYKFGDMMGTFTTETYSEENMPSNIVIKTNCENYSYSHCDTPMNIWTWEEGSEPVEIEFDPADGDVIIPNRGNGTVNFTVYWQDQQYQTFYESYIEAPGGTYAPFTSLYKPEEDEQCKDIMLFLNTGDVNFDNDAYIEVSTDTPYPPSQVANQTHFDRNAEGDLQGIVTVCHAENLAVAYNSRLSYGVRLNEHSLAGAIRISDIPDGGAAEIVLTEAPMITVNTATPAFFITSGRSSTEGTSGIVLERFTTAPGAHTTNSFSLSKAEAFEWPLVLAALADTQRSNFNMGTLAFNIDQDATYYDISFIDFGLSVQSSPEMVFEDSEIAYSVTSDVKPNTLEATVSYLDRSTSPFTYVLHTVHAPGPTQEQNVFTLPSINGIDLNANYEFAYYMLSVYDDPEIDTFQEEVFPKTEGIRVVNYNTVTSF